MRFINQALEDIDWYWEMIEQIRSNIHDHEDIKFKKGYMNKFKLDKTAFSVGFLNDASDEKAYWLSKSPSERLEMIEFLRRINYGEAAASGRLQRFFEITKLS